MASGKSIAESENEINYLQQFLHRLREALLIILFAASSFLLLSLVTYQASDSSWSHVSNSTHFLNLGGKVGAWLSDFIFYLLGYVAFLLPIMLMTFAWRLYRSAENSIPLQRYWVIASQIIGSLCLISAAASLMNLYLPAKFLQLPLTSGGLFGQLLSQMMLAWFNRVGATVLLLAIFSLGISLVTGLSWFGIFEKIGEHVFRLFTFIKKPQINWHRFLPRLPRFSLDFHWLQKFTFRQSTPITHEEPQLLPETETALEFPETAATIDPPVILKPEKLSTIIPPIVANKKKGGAFLLPKLSLLNTPISPKGSQYTRAQLEERSREVEERLRDFGVNASVEAVFPGPVVTRYEIGLAAGTKVSKITGLAKDLARSLSVSSVRVVEVISGKSVIGIELPNEHREIVTLKEVLNSKNYQQSTSALSLALGKDIAGNPVTVDLAKMPHLLVAGTTGSGKSVSVNAMLLSMLYKATPEELRLIMIDPKMLELSIYDDIPHLLVPVVTDMKDAATALRWCVVEMERRYRLMAALGVRNIAGFNEKVRAETIPDPLWGASQTEPAPPLTTIPQIVVVVDEFADLMMVVGKKVETLIARLAQKARAAGIHLILATQRPSVDVITGLIKANIPARIAFQVSSRIDSRTILDQQGAEQLLGHGDMLYLAAGTGLPKRIHGAFVDDDEVHRVTTALKANGIPDYLEDILDPTASTLEPGSFGNLSDEEEGSAEQDEFYDEAVQFITKARRVSVSSVQRRFKIGYNRASRIVEAMEKAGVVSPMEQNGSREVLAPPPIET